MCKGWAPTCTRMLPPAPASARAWRAGRFNGPLGYASTLMRARVRRSPEQGTTTCPCMAMAKAAQRALGRVCCGSSCRWMCCARRRSWPTAFPAPPSRCAGVWRRLGWCARLLLANGSAAQQPGSSAARLPSWLEAAKVDQWLPRSLVDKKKHGHRKHSLHQLRIRPPRAKAPCYLSTSSWRAACTAGGILAQLAKRGCGWYMHHCRRPRCCCCRRHC